jgi:uncharacterized protein
MEIEANSMEDPRGALQAALKEAMMNKDAQRREVLRGVMSAIKQVEIDERRELSAEDVVMVLQKEVKKRRESIDEAQKAGRNDIVETEAQEVGILEVFLPKQLTRDELTAIVKEAISVSGATNAKEMGKVMAVLMPKVKGLADGKLVNEVVRELLG